MIIVTGGAGMIGSNIVAALNADGHYDILVVDDLTDGHKIANLADLAIADYLDKDEFLREWKPAMLGRIEAVFHQGACSTTTEWNGKFMMDGELRLFEAAAACLPVDACTLSLCLVGLRLRRRHGVSRGAGAERPLNVYAYSKKLFDDYVRRTVLPNRTFAGRRPALLQCLWTARSPQGRRWRRSPSICSTRSERGENPKLFGAYDGFGPGEQSRDFIHVGDVADVNLWLWKRGIERHLQLRHRPRAAIPRHRRNRHRHAGQGRDRIRRISRPPQGRYQSFTQADMSRLRAAGYNGHFRSVETGVRDYVEWLKAQRSS